MPLTLVPPEKIKGAKSYYIRGTHLGVRVYESTGTDREPLARTALRLRRESIERDHYAPAARPEPVDSAEETFAHAAAAYLERCPLPEVKRVERLLEHLRETALSAFDKDFIDRTEREMFPGYKKTKDAKGLTPYSAGTLNREFRTPLAAVLHDAAERQKMPWLEVEKYGEPQRTKFQEPEVAAQLIAAAAELDREAERLGRPQRLAPLLIALYTTGLRISEAVKIDWPLVNLERGELGPLVTKNGEEYTVAIGQVAVVAIANLPGKRAAGVKIFGFKDRHAVKYPLSKACEKLGLVKKDAAGKTIRDRNGRAKPTITLHQARHSFMTWLRRNGEDLKKRMELGRYKDMRSMLRYEHIVPQEHAPAIARLPLQLVDAAAPIPPAADAKERKQG
jgi:integrase